MGCAFDRTGAPAPRAGFATLIACFLALVQPSIAWSHTFAPGILDLREETPGTFVVHWQPPGASTEAPSAASVLTLQWPAQCLRPPSPSGAALDTRAPARWRMNCGPQRLRGGAIALANDSAALLDVLVRITWRDGTAVTGVLHRGAPQFTLPPARVSSSDATTDVLAATYVHLGVEHILLGIDHLLFVLALLLLVPQWSTLIKTLTAFTLAHSVTLACAVLDVLSVAPAPVEALIAVSIVLVAAEVARPADALPSLTRRRPWVVAFLFGLLHGLGFAGALTALGLPPAHVPLALVAFNCGVELGQVLFVMAMAVPVAAWRRLAQRTPIARLIPAYAIGTVAVAWAIERVQHFWA